VLNRKAQQSMKAKKAITTAYYHQPKHQNNAIGE